MPSKYPPKTSTSQVNFDVNQKESCLFRLLNPQVASTTSMPFQRA